MPLEEAFASLKAHEKEMQKVRKLVKEKDKKIATLIEANSNQKGIISDQRKDIRFLKKELKNAGIEVPEVIGSA